ncbi:hypothetical protein FS837_007309 [Tulasnella sp. UAMH 9824]|nr:hypothetical protein FS837_007309 [Tulasnella sp. UAMH 9824]
MDQDPQNPPEPPKRKTVSDNYLPKVSPGFGHIDDFWKRYDELADRNDREMVANLNTNLDALLIFAGLFSAVNTAFISAAMPSLSPNASDRTNALLELLDLRPENTTLTPAETSPPFTPPRNDGCHVGKGMAAKLQPFGAGRPAGGTGPVSAGEVRKYPRIIARIAMALKASPTANKGRWMGLICASTTVFVGKRNLSVWEDAELGTHAVGHLRRAASYLHLTSTAGIVRRLISLSVDCSTELLAAEIINEVSKKANQWPLWGENPLQAIYMELLDLILKIWDAALRSKSVRSICWPTNGTLDALRILLPHVNKHKVFSRDSRTNFSNLPTLSLLVDYLRKRKPETDFIARNLDISINRLFDAPESGFRWNYLLYTDERPSKALLANN